MGLVGEATLGGDLTQRLVGRQHQALRPLHSASNDVLVWGLTHTLTERDVEVGFAETGNRGKILVTDRGVQVRVDVSQNAPYLPGRKALRRDAGRRHRRLLRNLQQRFRALKAL
jgi:hypothetical protein